MKNAKHVKQGKRFFLFVLFFVLGAGLIAPAGFSRAKTIEFNGGLGDWSDVTTLVDRGDVNHALANYTALGTTYYYNTSDDSWQTTNPGGETCKVNYNWPINIYLLKLTNDSGYLYGLWERGTDFAVFRYDSTNSLGINSHEYMAYSNDAAAAEVPLLPEADGMPIPNPCAGHILKTPADFDHDMVISIDKNRDGLLDYYLVIHVTFPAGQIMAAEGADHIVGQQFTSYIYQDNGNGAYDGRANETLLTALGDSDEGEQSFFITGGDPGVNYSGTMQQWRMSINSIFTDLGLNWGDTVDVRYEAHSEDSFTTEAAPYKFTLGLGSVKLTAKVKKKVKRSKVLVSGKTTKKASVSIAVNGGNSVSARVARNGKYRVWATLPVIGANTIVVTASHSAKDSKSVTKRVTRR